MQPFAGLEVLEFGQFIAVPFCAQLLAEGGAHVIKVESLEGDPVRNLAPLAPGETRHFISRNRGKHTLPLDLRHPGARPVIDRLVARADVVLTNFRPGLAEEIGLDYASLAPRHPRVVVGNVSAFGRRGPDAKLAGMDMVVQARSGLMATLGRLDGGVPTAGDAPVADYTCAMILAFGIAAALLRRERTGRGGEVDVALLMAGLLVQNNSLVRVESADGAAHAATRARLAELLDDPQVLANGLVHDLSHPALGPVRVLAPPLKLDGDGFVPAPATAAFGSETLALLESLGFSPAEARSLLETGVTQGAKRAGN